MAEVTRVMKTEMRTRTIAEPFTVPDGYVMRLSDAEAMYLRALIGKISPSMAYTLLLADHSGMAVASLPGGRADMVQRLYSALNIVVLSGNSGGSGGGL